MMDLQDLTKLLRSQLAHILQSVHGKKDLALDADLTRPLDRVGGISFLRDNEVDKIFKLEPEQKSLPGCDKRIYLVRPRMLTMKQIADHINTEAKDGVKRSYKIVMVPRKLHTCETILESEGVMGYVSIEEFPLELLPIDTDILSLELPEIYKEFYLDKDTTWLHTVASSLLNLQRLYGRIPNVYQIGTGSQMVFELMEKMFECHRDQKSSEYHIGQLFIIGRDVDYASLLCSPMTYEALLDETFGIECGMIDFGDVLSGNNKNSKQLLTNQDEIYSQIRDKHFSHIFAYLSAKAKDLKALHEKKDNLSSVSAMKDFVANDVRVLKQQQKWLETHIEASEHIMKTKNKLDFEEYIKTEHSILDGSDTRSSINYIEECIHKQFSLVQTLKLMCLLSLTQEGLSPKDYKAFKTQFLHSHGFEHLVTLFNLKKVGILNEQEVVTATSNNDDLTAKKSNYKALNKKFTLVPDAEEMDMKNPTDMSYVYSGAYTPLTCKLVEQILTRDTMIGLEGVGQLVGGLRAHITNSNRGIGKGSTGSVKAAMKVVLVYFLGGCTFSEIAALRFIAKVHGFKVIIATTSIITGNGLLESLMEKVNR